MRLLSYRKRQEGRCLDPVLSADGQVMALDSGSLTRRRGTAMKMFGSGIVAVTAVVAFVTRVRVSQSHEAPSAVDANGHMNAPEDYLRTSPYLGPWQIARASPRKRLCPSV